ncbi:hypothetical protein BT96DRAFT_1083700, partial [Gymnopus androsaceus JB14]
FQRSQLLKTATSLVKTHGFTREALSRSVLDLPSRSDFKAHSEPLSDIAVSSLFGHGDTARKTLIEAWLDEGIVHMGTSPASSAATRANLARTLHARLDYNTPVLHYLPEAFALLASPERALPPIDPRAALKHASRVADEACYISGDASNELSWYTRRASLAAIYSAAELHQFTSPETAHAFLDSLLTGSSVLKDTLDEVQLFSTYVFKSWKGIIQSRGIF